MGWHIVTYPFQSGLLDQEQNVDISILIVSIWPCYKNHYPWLNLSHGKPFYCKMGFPPAPGHLVKTWPLSCSQRRTSWIQITIVKNNKFSLTQIQWSLFGNKDSTQWLIKKQYCLLLVRRVAIDLRCGGLTPGEKGNKSAKMLFFRLKGEYLWVTRKHRSLNPLVALPNPSHTWPRQGRFCAF